MKAYKLEIGSDDGDLTKEEILRCPIVEIDLENYNPLTQDDIEESDDLEYFAEAFEHFNIYQDDEVLYFTQKGN